MLDIFSPAGFLRLANKGVFTVVHVTAALHGSHGLSFVLMLRVDGVDVARYELRSFIAWGWCWCCTLWASIVYCVGMVLMLHAMSFDRLLRVDGVDVARYELRSFIACGWCWCCTLWASIVYCVGVVLMLHAMSFDRLLRGDGVDVAGRGPHKTLYISSAQIIILYLINNSKYE